VQAACKLREWNFPVDSDYQTLRRDENQALGLGQFALDFLSQRFGDVGDEPLERVEQFHRDSIACGVSALALRTNAPTVLRAEAMEYPAAGATQGVPCFGSRQPVMPEKAVVANSSAVREWDSNGTNFGYNPARGATRGEFGHNDFYPVAIAAVQLRGLDGRQTVLAMLLLDEIRGRLAEVFALKNHKIDHVVHGAIASAVTYGAVLGATPRQIESAVGMVVAHYIPFRAIRAGKQLSDSKGASAAISAEVAVLSMRRAMRGFVGPADIFRNPEAIFCLFEKPPEKGVSPFDLTLSGSGSDFAVMGMHFKLGLYEHQSAGAIEGLMNVLAANPKILSDPNRLQSVRITIYEPAFGIIGDPAKRDPQTRQSADHSMVYIVATLLRKAFQLKTSGWQELMLVPDDYEPAALHDPLTRSLIDRIEFRHGGPEFDIKYPDGIPTMLDIGHADLGPLSSGLVMYPEGHARNESGHLSRLLEHKFRTLAGLAVDDVAGLSSRFSGLRHKMAGEIATLYDFRIRGVE
jgi:2-methylcitrate dehydratase